MKEEFESMEYNFECKGRDYNRKEVLKEPIDVKLLIYKKPGSNIVSSEVDCDFIRGGHGECCGASKSVNPVYCPYAFDLPHAPDKRF